MSPILGIMASQGTGARASSYESIQTVTVSSATSTISLTSIPSTYTHLQLRCAFNGTAAGTYNNIRMKVNSDSGNNYSMHQLYGDGTTAGVASEINTGNGIYGLSYVTQASTANYLAIGIINVLNYANSNMSKSFSSINGLEMNGSGSVAQFGTGLWNSTSTITTLTFATASGNFNVGSTVALYGIKAI